MPNNCQISHSCIVYAPTQVFQFLNAKCESAFLAKRNPRQINWTVLYRRKHKKGQSVSTSCASFPLKCWQAVATVSVYLVKSWQGVFWCAFVFGCGWDGVRGCHLRYVLLPGCVLQLGRQCSLHIPAAIDSLEIIVLALWCLWLLTTGQPPYSPTNFTNLMWERC